MKTFRIFLLVLLTGSSNLYTSATPLPDADLSPATIEAEPELVIKPIKRAVPLNPRALPSACTLKNLNNCYKTCVCDGLSAICNPVVSGCRSYCSFSICGTYTPPPGLNASGMP
ncbi:hypothetical protein TWF569_006206 [Orbilia oligospora]|uniref:Uncharacterized protein n=1 Tax=Orbilia oligospora TaxID=2813651 RepID=A0A7C8NJ65_ORBOL|nr:hypothetical protein TWF706_001801 [Orbilia oligospora]KAF3110615.1 hypothetical protein TWF102_008185 [Orbilia oligospora]KAF3114784.1 hypothetical protein TWF103_000516 [Orbilia oligospora]KAF3143440.1 hypothetical protein TWF703_010854 [Orbilia oligospora]KAF3147119.1 hypothetical protein TWF569_006206 [Orbilia oligospora]